MMTTLKELQDVINSTNVVLEELLHETVDTLSLEHVGAIGDPQLAFSQLLNQYLPKVREVTKLFNAEKIFTSKDKYKLQSKIDIRNLDNALVIALLKIEDMLGIERSLGNCTNPTHQQICCEDCNVNCIHSSPTCKKCISGGGTRSKACKHECRKCKRTIEQCGSESKLCCSNCNICMDCNKKLANLEMVVRAKMAVTSSQQPCARYLVLFCLEILLKWRNLFAHKTTQQLQDFINGIKLIGFEICEDSQQLFSYFKVAFLVLLEYVRETSVFKIKPLQEFKYQKLCKDLDDIFSCGERLEAYLKKSYLELNSLLERTSVELKKTIQIANNDQCSNQSVQSDDNDAGSPDKWRRIYRGVVLRLDIPPNEEIQKIDCCKTSPGKDSFIIKHKSCIGNKEDQYYETHRVNDTLMLLRIENMEDGNYKINVSTKSMLKSFAVEANHQQTNPTFHFSKISIEVPSSDWTEFWHEMQDTIDSSKKDNDCKIVFSKGASTTVHTLKDFEEIGKKYLERNFTDEELVTCFKPTHLIDNETLKNVIGFFEWLLSRYCYVKIFILVSPDLNYHLAMINDKADILREMKRYFQPCLLIFVKEKSLIMIVRIVLDTHIQHDIVNTCQFDILNFMKINGCKLGKEKINIVCVVACPFIKRNQLKDLLPYQFASCRQHLYEKFFLCEDDLQLNENYTIDEWWNTVPKGNICVDETLFSSLIGSHMASMASVQEGLPTLDDCTHQQLLTLLLNPSQITAIESNDRKKLITGPFGSGKSLVGQRILRKMAAEIRKSKEPGMLAYISCDPYSIIDAHVKDIMQVINDDDMTFLCGSMHNLFKVHVHEDTSNAALDVLVKALTTNYKNCSFVIDEINEASMTEEVAKNINENLKNSHIVFIQQSIKKERTYTENGKDHLLEADHFSLIDNLERHPLQHVMRLTLENQELVDCTQRIIEQQTLEVLLPESQTNEPQQSMSVEAVQVPIRKFPQNSSIELSPKQIPQSTSVHQTVAFHDFDVSLRWMANSQSSTTSNQMIRTDFGFLEGEEGHNIKHCKPELYQLPESIPIELDTIIFLSHIFNLLCFQQGENPVCVAYSMVSAEVFYRIIKSYSKRICLYIPYLQQRIPSLKEKEEVIRKMRESSVVLITDNHSFIGMEAKNMVTMADPKEKYLRHSVVEIVSRCTTNLKMFVPFYDKIDVGTMSEIFQGWKNEQLVKVTNIVLNTQKQTNRPIAICPKSNDVIVYGKAKCIMQHNLHQLSIEERKKFHVFQHQESISNFIKSKISRFQSPSSRIFHHVEVDGKRLDFYDVWRMLRGNDFSSFERIVGIDPNIINNMRRDDFIDDTFLMYAIWFERDYIVEYLTTKFTKQIDYIAKNCHEWTVFHYAALRNNIDVMNILISKDLRGLECCDNRGETPLFYAASDNHKSMVELILKHGVDPHIKNYDDLTAYQQGNVNEDIQLIIQNYQTKNASAGTF